MKPWLLPSGLQDGIALIIHKDWSTEQAVAVVELLGDMHDVILKFNGSEVLTAYVPGPKGPVFMSLLERTFGTSITTRTLDTVRKCASA